MSAPAQRIAYLTAGASGMFCGSCMRDNTLAAALARQGCDVQLIPTYTPIRTDEENVAIDEVFYGGINVFLQHRIPLFRYLPAALDHWLDRPWIINRLTRGKATTSGKLLGSLVVSMLRGERGAQRKEVRRLVRWLADHARPNLINLSNVLISGCVPAIKQKLDVPVLVTLQGDDLFLDELIEPYRQQALQEIRSLVGQIDGFLVFSRYYADYMSDLLAIPREKIHLVPMGLNLSGFSLDDDLAGSDGPPTIGYLARVCPAKGFHVLVQAFDRLRQMPGMREARLHAAGWLGEDDRAYFETQVQWLHAQGHGEHFHYAGAVDRQQKIDFLRALDVLSVPTTYHEPKGIFVLEALAAGVPVVQPQHGAFPELLAATGGGRLVRPDDVDHLAETLHHLLTDVKHRSELAQSGRQTVHARFHADAMAAATLAVYQKFLARDNPATTSPAAAAREQASTSS